MSHPRDPRARRERRDPLAAAVALELAADSMREHLTTPEPEPDLEPVTYAPEVVEHLEQWDTAALYADDRPQIERLAEQYAEAEAATERAQLDAWAAENPPGASESEHIEPAPLVPEPALGTGAYRDHYFPWVAGGQVPEEPPAPPVPPAAPAPVYGSEHPPSAWRSVHDPRSLAFGVDRLFAGAGPLQDVRLPTGPVLDQLLAGATLEEQSCCTGCGTVAARNVLGRSEPMDGRFPALDLDDAERVYDRARQVDEYLGDHTTGSSVLGAMKAAVELGLIGGYLWCFGTRQIAQTLIQKRLPVVAGVRWTSGMWQTGPGGLVVLDGDPNAMGHCLAIVGLSLKGPQGQPGPFFVWQNSAGESYGDGGFGYVHHRDLSRLLRGVGEAAVPMLTPQEPK